MDTAEEINAKWEKCNIRLDKCREELKEFAITKLESERLYKMALASKMLILRSEKYPATLINDLARGDEEVSLLRMKRDTQRILYSNCKINVEACRDAISILQSKMSYIRQEFTTLGQMD